MDKFGRDYDNVHGWNRVPANDKQDAKPDVRRTRMELEQLKLHFNRQATEYARMEKAVTDALELLKDAEAKQAEAAEKTSRLGAEQRGALLKGMMLGAKNKPEFVLLIDGSGSMIGSPLNAALDGATVLKQADAKVALWGDKTPVWITDKIGVDAERAKIRNGLNTGSDLAPAVSEVAATAALNTLSGRKTHVVLVSDGDIFDGEKAKTDLLNLLSTNKKTTLDVVILGRKDTQMEKLMTEVAGHFPGRVNQRVIEPQGGQSWGGYDTRNTFRQEIVSTVVQDAMIEIVAERLRPAARKPKAAPKP